VSNFYDAKMWVALALAIAALQLGARRPDEIVRNGLGRFTYSPIVPEIRVSFPGRSRLAASKPSADSSPANQVDGNEG
jgi:hypothetical protein